MIMRTVFFPAVVFAAAIFLFGGNALATRVVPREFTCPVCGNKFESMVLTSYFDFGEGTRLDFKSGMPILIPQCTQCLYVFRCSHKTLDGRVITAKETAKIKAFVFSSEYRKLPASTPEYHRLAIIMEQLEVSADSLADAYLTASWEYESLCDPKTGIPVPNREQMVVFCLQKSLSLLDANPFPPTAPLRDRLPAAYLRVELNRRLGNFPEAEKRIRDVEKQLERAESLIEHFNEDNANMVRMYRKYTRQQADLVGRRISEPTNVDES